MGLTISKQQEKNRSNFTKGPIWKHGSLEATKTSKYFFPVNLTNFFILSNSYIKALLFELYKVKL